MEASTVARYADVNLSFQIFIRTIDVIQELPERFLFIEGNIIII